MTNSFTVKSLIKIHEDWGEDPSEFSIQFQVELCSAETIGGEAFAVTVMSPIRLDREMKESSHQIEAGRGIVFMIDYDENALLDYLQRFISGIAAPSWDELAQRVEYFFDWLN